MTVDAPASTRTRRTWPLQPGNRGGRRVRPWWRLASVAAATSVVAGCGVANDDGHRIVGRSAQSGNGDNMLRLGPCQGSHQGSNCAVVHWDTRGSSESAFTLSYTWTLAGRERESHYEIKSTELPQGQRYFKLPDEGMPVKLRVGDETGPVLAELQAMPGQLTAAARSASQPAATLSPAVEQTPATQPNSLSASDAPSGVPLPKIPCDANGCCMEVIAKGGGNFSWEVIKIGLDTQGLNHWHLKCPLVIKNSRGDEVHRDDHRGCAGSGNVSGLPGGGETYTFEFNYPTDLSGGYWSQWGHCSAGPFRVRTSSSTKGASTQPPAGRCSVHAALQSDGGLKWDASYQPMAGDNCWIRTNPRTDNYRVWGCAGSGVIPSSLLQPGKNYTVSFGYPSASGFWGFAYCQATVNVPAQ